MKVRIPLIVLTILLPVIIVLVRVQNTKDLVHGKHGFYRHFIPDAVVVLQKIIPVQEQTRICGRRYQRIYFQTKKIDQLLEFDRIRMQIKTIHLKLNKELLSINRWEYHIDSCGFFLLAGNLPAVFVSGTIDSLGFDQKMFLPGIAVRGNWISKKSILIKGFENDSSGLNPILYQINLQGKMIHKSGRLFTGNDLGMQSDGQLGYDGRYILQTRFYDHLYMRLDASLHSMDSFSTVEGAHKGEKFISSFRYDSSNLFTQVAPDWLLHPQSCVYQGLLFLQSRVKSDGETETEFLDHVVIDTYCISDGSYLGSFYLPKIKGDPIMGMMAFNEGLAGFTKHAVVLFTWNFSFLIQDLKKCK